MCNAISEERMLQADARRKWMRKLWQRVRALEYVTEEIVLEGGVLLLEVSCRPRTTDLDCGE